MCNVGVRADAERRHRGPVVRPADRSAATYRARARCGLRTCWGGW